MFSGDCQYTVNPLILTTIIFNVSCSNDILTSINVVANLLMCGMCTWSVRTGVVCDVRF